MISKKQLERLKDRYLRKVIAGKGFWHHGDCYIFSEAGICTCGLIHDLIYLDRKDAKKLYKDFSKDYQKHMLNLDDHMFYARDRSGVRQV